MKTLIISGIALALVGVTVSAQIVVSEIHYHPVEEPAFNADGTPFLDLSEDVHEFLELQNTAATPVGLNGWTLGGGIKYAFPTNTTVAAGSFLVIAKNPARLATVYGLVPATVLGPYTGTLGNSGDTVRVSDASGQSVDAVTYSAQFPWPGAADALGASDRFTGLTSSNYQYKGRSLQRVSVTWPSGDPANWLASPLTGPSPGAAQAVTRTVPKPVVIAKSAVQTADGAVLVRAGNAVTVNCAYSSVSNLSSVTLEYFIDNVNSNTEPRLSVAMTELGRGQYTASIPGQVDRSIVRYRFKANRGDGLEVVSPRADDPQIAPIGANGVREAWHGYFVTPVRTSANPIYDVFVSTAALGRMNSNIIQSPKRVTVAAAAGLPRDLPYVAATAPLWDGTQPGVCACNGEVWDIQIRYHGSLYHRAAANNSFKVHFPDHQPFHQQSAWFETGHGTEFMEAQKLNRLLGLPASKMRTVDWYYNSNAKITRNEQGEYADEMLADYHDLMQQLNPGSAKEPSGELYKDVGDRDPSQNNTEGPYTRGDEAPLAANTTWTQLQRYSWVFSLQDHAWKGPKPVRDLIEGLWTARGDTPSTHNFSSSPTSLANARAWFTNNWDIPTTLTSMALLEWMSIWDDAAQNHFFWRRASGQWSRLGWDYDSVMSTSSPGGAGSPGGTTNQTIYGGEYGATTVFDGVNWWKDTFYKCFRTEFNQRLWDLNNSFCDPTNLTAQGLTIAPTFAKYRQTYVNAQLSALGAYSKPARPSNLAPAAAATILSATNLTTSAYAHPQGAAQASTQWEIRTAAGDYEMPVLRLTSTVNKIAWPVPFDQLTYGQTYYWRATHLDTNGHASIVSAETSFTWGTSATTAGTLVLNEVLAITHQTAQNGGAYPDYVELRNNGGTALDLTGYTLTDDPLVPAKFTFPTGTTLGANGYLLVLCDSDFSAAGLHTGFGLNGDGDQLLLLHGTTIVDSLMFGPQAPDISLGRIANGTGGWQANTPTPGAANSASTLGSVASLRLNEWMANPAYGEDWFELYNSDTNVVALGGLYLSDQPATPANTQIPALSFIAPKGFTQFWADSSTAGGNHCNFKLSKSGESLVLSAANGATVLDTITFSAQASDVSQGRLPDGGNTIVSFSAQTVSPGSANWAPALVYINEVLANTAGPFEDALELYNPTASPVSIGGWWLSNDRTHPRKFQIPAGAGVAAGGYAVFYKADFNSGASPFPLEARGGELILSAVDGAGALTGYGSLVRFGPSAENVSFGRVAATGLKATSGGAEFWPQAAHTFGQDTAATVAQFRSGTGAANGAPKTGPVTINEIMYHPPDGPGGADNTRDEFIELYNPTAGAVDLGGWRLRGDADYTFPAGTSLAPGAYLLLVSFDPTNAATLAALRATYSLTIATPVFGPYSAKLQNDTHNVEIACPVVLDGAADYLLVDKVEYRDLAPWPTSPDGTGHSLQRTSSSAIGNTAANWIGAAPTPGAPNVGVVSGVSITTASPLPGGVVGRPYALPLAAQGGKTPYTWTITAGAVPGLTLASDGTFSGNPTTVGAYGFTVQVTDSAGALATEPLVLTLAAAALGISSGGSLPEGAIEEPYAQTLTATGGTPPYAWSLGGGSLPPGLTLNAGGLVGGTPTAAGVFSFTMRVADSGGLGAAQDFSMLIPAPPLRITSGSPLLAAELGAAYSQALTGAGGVPPYGWTISGGALPTGLTLSSDGTVSGIPTVPGTFSFNVRLTDSLSSLATQTLALTVVPAALAITTAALPDGIVGAAYAQTFTVAGGVPTYSWCLASGNLPAGLSLSRAGVLDGTPGTAGAFSLTVQVVDGLSTTTTKMFRLSVGASGPLDHFTWDYVPESASAGTAFAVDLTARDSAERRVATGNSGLTLSAALGANQSTSPVLITELSDGAENQFELQNITEATASTAGWFVLLGDSQTDINTVNDLIYTLPASLPAGGLLRLTEQNSTAGGRTYFGGPIGWSSAAGNGKSWVMLFDQAGGLRDFVATGWTAVELATLSVEINGEALPPTGQWTGDGLLPGTRAPEGATVDSWQRIGRSDQNLPGDWIWSHHLDNSDATSFGLTNPGLLLPWPTPTSLGVTPTNAILSSGEFLGYLRLGGAGTNVVLTATDSATRLGASKPFTVGTALVCTAGDGIPDAWKTAHGFDAATPVAALDSDGDGASNLAEYLAGTDPRSGSSRLCLTSATISNTGECRVTWPAVAGKLYRISLSTDLVTWQTVQTTLATTTGSQSLLLDASRAPQFFVRVEIPPVQP